MTEACVDCGASHEQDHTYEQCVSRLVAQRDEAVRIARDLITWAKASDVSAGAVIDAHARLEKLSPGRDAATETKGEPR